MHPKVSICIPAFNQLEFLRKALNSVLLQTYSDYELIITDDSYDDSVKTLLTEFDFNGKLRYFHNTLSLGAAANWNYAAEKAEGDYIKFLHHDDFFTSSESLAKYVRLMEDNPNASFGFSGTEIVSLSLNIKKKHFCSATELKKITLNPDLLFFKNYIGAPSATIYKRESGIRFDTKLKWLVDVDFYINTLKKGHVFVTTPELLICTLDGGAGQVTQKVINERNVQIVEHVYLYLNKLDRNLNQKEYNLFFQLLFHKFNIRDIKELNGIIPIPQTSEAFFTSIMDSGKNFIFLKKVIFWLKKTTFSDYLFMIHKSLK